MAIPEQWYLPNGGGAVQLFVKGFGNGDSVALLRSGYIKFVGPTEFYHLFKYYPSDNDEIDGAWVELTKNFPECCEVHGYGNGDWKWKGMDGYYHLMRQQDGKWVDLLRGKNAKWVESLPDRVYWYETHGERHRRKVKIIKTFVLPNGSSSMSEYWSKL